MKLTAISVCVNYSDYLYCTISRNRPHFDRAIVVTTAEDDLTRTRCIWFDCEPIMYDGEWNLGAARLTGQRALTDEDDWVLMIDADILLPSDFRAKLEAQELDPTCLYGMHRRWMDQRDYREYVMGEGRWTMTDCSRFLDPSLAAECYGYFQLYHRSANRFYPPMPSPAEDVMFRDQWPREKRRVLDGLCANLGQPGQDWFGRKSERWQPWAQR